MHTLPFAKCIEKGALLVLSTALLDPKPKAVILPKKMATATPSIPRQLKSRSPIKIETDD